MSKTDDLVWDGGYAQRNQWTHNVSVSTALLFHMTPSHHLALVTTHPVRSIKGHPTICAGVPLSPAHERKVLDLLLSRDRLRQFVLPPNCLASSADAFAFWLPSTVRPMHLANMDGRSTILTRWPTLVIKVERGGLSMAALSSDQHPMADTALFHAPLPNVYEDGRLCTGDAVLPAQSDATTYEGWVSVINDSAFTHPNWRGGLAGAKKTETVESFWAKRDGVVDPFPANRLAPMNLTLAQWLDLSEDA